MCKGVEGGVRIGCGKGSWSLWRMAVWWRCGALAIAGLFGEGCLAGFPEGTGFISGSWGFAVFFGALRGFRGFRRLGT